MENMDKPLPQRHHIGLSIFLTLVFLLNGCGNIGPDRATNVPTGMINEMPGTNGHLPLSTPADRTPTKPPATMTISPTSSGKNTMIPNSTVTHTSTVVATDEPLATATAYPTLNASEKEMAVRWVLSENSDCELPCFGGVHPGITKLEAAKSAFIEMGFPWSDPFKFYWAKGSAYYTGIDLLMLDVSLKGTLFTLTGHEEVDAIYVSLVGSDIAKVAPTYQLSTLIKTLGQPDEVKFSTIFNDQLIYPPYEIWIFYSKGIVIKFYGHAVVEGDYLKVCPKDPLRFVKDKPQYFSAQTLFLQSPFSQRNLDDLIGIFDRGYPLSQFTLEEAANLTTADFYRMMTENLLPECFSTPAKLWITDS